MILMSRLSFISSHLGSIKCLSALRNYSTLYPTSYRVSNGFHPSQTLTSYKQRNFSSDKEQKDKVEAIQTEVITGNRLSQRARLKQAVRDYGATIIVFHISLALTSLGICYLAVSNGIDAVSLLKRLGFSESVITSNVAVEGSTFLMSYAVHKLFAPVRIGITLSAAPLIVRYLRKKKFLKSPK